MNTTPPESPPLLLTYESKRSYGVVWGAVAFLLLGLPFLGRQRITITDQRIIIQQGFWTKTSDDIEIFRIRDVVVKQSLYHRMVGIGDVVIKSMEGRSEELHVLKGVPGPDAVSAVIRNAWNAVARPKGPATALD
ncbi:PH domain-containing protein [Sediminicoccus sp. KRV36]|uniref:PH domain-containing protein n=1 Tax=Sediminicoccus sp. KRV36 TaxID=3133721 RepID=UPI00201094D3|nr:PH domain-containing protein [Sediminicoccus rosea]UPY36775.1 PH domain-containing protein [Sediminicoccus rosea]